MEGQSTWSRDKMSHQTYNELWFQAQFELENLAVLDYENQGSEAQFDRTVAQTQAFELYVKYISMANRLDEIYDQILQPQKRIVIRKLLDASLGRVIELKNDLVNIDMNEFSYNDEVMEKLRLTPLDVELNVPKYFRREREQIIQHRKKTMDEIIKKLDYLDESICEESLTEMEAIRIIQMHERARQGRLRAQFMKEIKLLKEKGKPDGIKDKTSSGLMAAMKIQKMWRGYATRQQTRRKKMEEMILIGMLPPLPTNKRTAIDEAEDVSYTS